MLFVLSVFICVHLWLISYSRRGLSTMTAPLLVRAARGEVVERPPVWAMRQAGRWDPEFNKIRAGLTFYEFSA